VFFSYTSFAAPLNEFCRGEGREVTLPPVSPLRRVTRGKGRGGKGDGLATPYLFMTFLEAAKRAGRLTRHPPSPVHLPFRYHAQALKNNTVPAYSGKRAAG